MPDRASINVSVSAIADERDTAWGSNMRLHSHFKETVLLLGATFLGFSSGLYAECTAPLWDAHSPYSRGDIVSYGGNEWRAKRNTSGVVPGTHKPTWADLGNCDDEPGEPPTDPPSTPTPIQILGVWHCGNNYCDWSRVRETSPDGEFDRANRWIIDRDPADGLQGPPSVNLVILSFLEPLKLLHGHNDQGFVDGVPRGMTEDVVNYFKSHGIRVMVSMGGVTYTESWNQALIEDAAGLADKAFDLMISLGSDGMEIDWENGTPDSLEMAGIEAFIARYNTRRSGIPDHFLTLDLAVGNRYLQELSRRAAADWLPNGKIDYINAMVARGEPSTDQWQEHVDGKSNYNPPILPKAPAKIAVSLWLTDGRRPNENCVDYGRSSMKAKREYVETVAPSTGIGTPGFLGFMFWAAECPSTRNVCTTPPNSCEKGLGIAADTMQQFIPIAPLRSE